MIISINDKVCSMYNTNTNSPRTSILVTKNTDIKGIVSLVEDTISLGYNETIVCFTNEDAAELFYEICKTLEGGNI